MLKLTNQHFYFQLQRTSWITQCDRGFGEMYIKSSVKLKNQLEVNYEASFRSLIRSSLGYDNYI